MQEVILTPMAKIPFREHHLFQLLEAFDQQNLPLDFFISLYFRSNKALGSKDRGFISEAVYTMIRWRGLLDYLCRENSPPTWEDRFKTLLKVDLVEIQEDESIPLHHRVSFPKVLFDILTHSFALEKAIDFCLASNYPAPTTVRANALKITREALLDLWKPIYDVIPTKFAPHGITFQKKINFFDLASFKEGLFEVQDEGSQLLAGMVKAQPGQWVMDYCAGSGGKTLAFAPFLNKTGQIYLHDIRPQALLEGRKRLKRAGIQNAQIVKDDDEEKLKKLKRKMDWVLVDAPCTGTGTLRRNPDMKWNFQEETLKRLVGQQRVIFERALSYVKVGGCIVYGTCSVLREENQDQLDHFIKTYPLEMIGTPFTSVPSRGSMDGFFGVTFRLKKD